MGISTSPLQLAGKLLAAAEVVRTASTTGVERAALAFKAAEVAAAPSRLRNVGKKGSKLGVSYTGGKYSDGAKYLVYATGPWPIINNDIKPHIIPKLKASGKSKAAKPLHGPAFGGLNIKKLELPGGGVRDSVFHPGTKGKHIWEKTEAVFVPLAPRIIDEGVIGALRTIF